MLARTLLFCSALLLVCLGPAQLAHADPLPLEQSLPVDGQSLQVRVAVEGEGIRLTVRAGGASAQADIPLPEAAEASAEVVRVAASREVLVIRARGRGEAAAVVAWVRGRPSVVWSARTDARGDPGERRREVLSLTDRTGDGLADVVVGVRREGVEVCGQQETLLMPRALDPASGQLRPVILRRFDATAAVPVTARRAADRAPPLVRALRPTGASSRAGATEESFALGAPHALTDADPTTFWAEGRGGAGAGELVTLRWDARLPIRAFAIRAATGAGASLGRPRTFYLVGDEGPPLAVTMPEDAGLHPGDRYWIEAPAPLRWRCVSLVLDQAYAPPRTAEAAVHTGLGEIEAYTEIDLGEGIVALVGLLVEGGSTGDEAARLLGALGAEAAGAILDAWERLDETGRRRAVRALAEQARRGVQQAYSGLERATRTDEPEQARVPALEALGTLIEPAATAILATRVTTDDAAILPLLRHPGATAALLAALAIEGGSERPTLRLAIAAAATRAEAADEVRAWAAQAPIAARASVALGLASRATSHALAAEVLRLCLADAARFEDRFRLALAAKELAADAPADAWLETVAGGAEEWMLRAAAVDALGRRRAGQEAVLRALEDDYPRVRVAAIRALPRAGQAIALTRLAERDRWPMVRAAADEALSSEAAARPVLRAAVGDRSPQVRRTAITTLAQVGDRDAWPAVERRLRNGDEWPQVVAAGLRYIQQLCLQEAGPAVLDVLRRGLRPEAWPPDVDLAALAADLALTLGGETAAEARTVGGRATAPAVVRAAIERHRGGRCGD